MDKLKSLIAILKEVSQYDASLRKDAAAIVRLLNKFHKDVSALAKFDREINGFLEKAQRSQTHDMFPKTFYVRLVGSVLEFDRECDQLKANISV